MPASFRLSNVLAFFLLFAILIATESTLQAQAPKLISYQGKLADASGNPLADGNYNIKFSVYDDINSGSAIWDETQGVTTQQGLFGVQLGSQTAINLAFDKPYFLGVKVESDPEMSPRTPLLASPYSMHAITVANGAITEGKIANNAISNSKIKNETIASNKLQPGSTEGLTLMTTASGAEWVDAKVPMMYRHTSTAANVVSRRTRLDHPLLNNNPNALVMVIHDFTFDFIVEPLGVWYNGSQWTIFRQDGAITDFPEDYRFNVLFVADPS